MRTSTCFAAASVVATVAIGACSSSSSGSTGAEATGDTGTGGMVPISTSSATTGTGGAATTASSVASTGAGGAIGTNGCDPAAATDLTGMAAVTINFGGGTLGSHYDKTCIRVDVGTMVTFAGDFVTHPLEAGDMPPATDGTSPIKETSTGMSRTFTLATAGTYGFFCMFHYSFGMKGAIIVQ